MSVSRYRWRCSPTRETGNTLRCSNVTSEEQNQLAHQTCHLSVICRHWMYGDLPPPETLAETARVTSPTRALPRVWRLETGATGNVYSTQYELERINRMLIPDLNHHSFNGQKVKTFKDAKHALATISWSLVA